MVVGYGQIIPQSVIDIPPLGIINVHASLLPKYRGAAPIQWAIANGETRTGVTTMRIDAGLDTGDMLLKAETEIGAGRDGGRTGRAPGGDGRGPAGRDAGRTGGGHDRAARSRMTRRPRYAPILKKEDGRIDWTRAGAADPQSRARIAAVARRVHGLSRPDVCTSGGRGWRRRNRLRRAGCWRVPQACRGVRELDRAGIARSAAGRAEENVRRGVRQRAAFDRK